MLLNEIDRVSKIVKAFKEKRVRMFAHFDADGMASAAIMAKAFLREGFNFELRAFKQLTADVIKELRASERDFMVFVDFGSGQLEALKKLVESTHVLILDHHEPAKLQHMNLFHLNPIAFGEEEISSSMLCYLFAKAIDIKNTDLIDLAIVGAVADEQDERWEFKGLARKILKEAETIGKISVVKGLRLYGRNTRPVHKALEYSFDPFIPGISGSESQAVQFLSELGIAIRSGESWRRLSDLTLEEQKKLASAIIVERLRSKSTDAADIFGEVYTLMGRPEELQDAREFATLINACGRTGHISTAVRLCLDDQRALSASWLILDEYRKHISDGINWVRAGNAESGGFATYIFGKNKIPDTLIGTIASIALNSNVVDADKPLFGFADAGDSVKVSARASKHLKLNLRDIIVSAAKAVGGEGGGHMFASGALIPRDKLKEFVKAVEDLLSGELSGKES